MILRKDLRCHLIAQLTTKMVNVLVVAKREIEVVPGALKDRVVDPVASLVLDHPLTHVRIDIGHNLNTEGESGRILVQSHGRLQDRDPGVHFMELFTKI